MSGLIIADMAETLQSDKRHT